METPRRYRRAGSSPMPVNYSAQPRMYGGSVPLKINFNSSRGPRAPPSRRRSAELRPYHRTHRDAPTMSPEQAVNHISHSPFGPPTATRDWAESDRQPQVEDTAVEHHSSGNTQSSPPTNQMRHLPPKEITPVSPPGLPQPSEVGSSPTSSEGTETPLTPQRHVYSLSEDTPLEIKSLRRDSPLETEFSPIDSSPPQHIRMPKPTGKRRRIPEAWTETGTSCTPSFDITGVAYKPDTVSSTDFQIPRKPPPIPKTAPKPAPLSLFPTTMSDNYSPPGSLRSGSTLVGCDVDAEPSTPTTVISAQKMADAFQASCSPGQQASSGWYDDEEGGERVGLMGRWRSSTGARRGIGGVKRLFCSCFGSN